MLIKAPLYRPERGTTAGSRWALWSWFEVPDALHPTRVYLRRLRVIQTPWFGVYLHWIYAPDRDRDPHDHPWPFVSWILRGGYTERVWVKMWHESVGFTRKRDRWSGHTMSTTVAHSVTAVDPGTVTFVVVGRRCRQWGFWTDQGWVAWPDYTREPSQ